MALEVFPTSPSWALCGPKHIISLRHSLLFPLPLLGSCSWLCPLAVLWVFSCRRQGAADKSKQPEPCTPGPARHGTATPARPRCSQTPPPPLLPMPRRQHPPHNCPEPSHGPPRSCWRQAEPPPPRPPSYLGAAAPSQHRSRMATKKPWVSVSAGEARRQHSAPGKAASPRQGQEGKAFTSLWRGTRVSAESRSMFPPAVAP